MKDEMQSLTRPPGFLINLLTAGIARALWICRTERVLHHRRRFLFAYLLLPFANYGLTVRLNDALRIAGSTRVESPLLVFLFTGWPLIGSTRRIRRAVSSLQAALAIRATAPVAVLA